MENDIPDELTPGERRRRDEADRIWGWREWEEDAHNQQRLQVWRHRWLEHFPTLWAINDCNFIPALAPRWKWKL